MILFVCIGEDLKIGEERERARRKGETERMLAKVERTMKMEGRIGEVREKEKEGGREEEKGEVKKRKRVKGLKRKREVKRSHMKNDVT